jgi:phosphoesterase RecJ-like protein
MNQSLRDAIAASLDRAQRILLITHVAPDGDAIGSLLGLGWLLRARGKLLTLACEDPVPENLRFLPAGDPVVRQADGTYDLLIGLDCSDRRRLGKVFTANLAALPLVNIDHHMTNTRFGTINWVDPAMAATSQMVLALADALGWDLVPDAATCLLTGLITDTRSFRTANVGPDTVHAALQLMEAGASLPHVAHQALDQRSLASIRLWGQAMDRLQLEDGILWTEVTRAMRRQWDVNGKDFSGLSNFLSGVNEARVVVLFTERDDATIDVSMRAAPGLDVAQVALRLGGGGHPMAAGCTLEGDLSQVQERVLAEVRRSLAEQDAARGQGEGDHA